MEAKLLARRAAGLSGAMPVATHEAISFGSGDASPSVMPDLTAAAEVALSKYRSETLQYAPRPGLPELREWIAAYMKDDGAEVPLEEIVVVNGAKHGIDLVCRVLLDEGDSIVVTAPTYFTAIPIFRSYGVRIIEVAQDLEGLSVSDLENALDRLKKEGRPLPKFIYNVPDFHNPSGVTMTRRRREGLMDVAARNQIMVVEDSPYRRVRFDGESEPMLKGLDRAHTILAGTFSKLIAPGLRIGWLSASADILARVLQLKSDGGTCPLTQRIIVEFCRAGNLAGHIKTIQRTYRMHRDAMVAAVRQALPQVTMPVPQGGYYLWLTLPVGIDGDELTKRAAQAGIGIISGTKFFAERGGWDAERQGPPRNYVRLAYSYATPEEIDDGVGRLGAILASMVSELSLSTG